MQNISPFYSIVINICGVIIGGLITWLVSTRYYLRASHDLSSATKEINEMSNFIVHILEQGENKKWEIKRDDQGKIIGLNITLTVSDCVQLQELSDAIVIEQSPKDSM